jgi:hypothetical protein
MWKPTFIIIIIVRRSNRKFVLLQFYANVRETRQAKMVGFITVPSRSVPFQMMLHFGSNALRRESRLLK